MLPNDISHNEVAVNDGGRKRALVAIITVSTSEQRVKMILRDKVNLSVRTKLAHEKASAKFVPVVFVEQWGTSVQLERLHDVQRLEGDADMVHGHLAGHQHGGRRDDIHAFDDEFDGRWLVRDECGVQEVQDGRVFTVEVQIDANGG